MFVSLFGADIGYSFCATDFYMLLCYIKTESLINRKNMLNTLMHVKTSSTIRLLTAVTAAGRLLSVTNQPVKCK